MILKKKLALNTIVPSLGLNTIKRTNFCNLDLNNGQNLIFLSTKSSVNYFFLLIVPFHLLSIITMNQVVFIQNNLKLHSHSLSKIGLFALVSGQIASCLLPK